MIKANLISNSPTLFNNKICKINDFFFVVQGIPGDKALIIGALNPPSLISITEIPNNFASSFDNFTLKFTPKIPLIFSLASDPKKSVVFCSHNEWHLYFQEFFYFAKLCNRITRWIQRQIYCIWTDRIWLCIKQHVLVRFLA